MALACKTPNSILAPYRIGRPAWVVNWVRRWPERTNTLADLAGPS